LKERDGEERQPPADERPPAPAEEPGALDRARGAERAQPARNGGAAGEAGKPAGGPIVWQVAGGPSVAAGSPLGQVGLPPVSRRTLMRIGFWTGLGLALAGSGGVALYELYPRGITGFGGKVSPGKVSDFPPGSKTHFLEGRFWLVYLTEEQGGSGLLALWQKCPHLGCTVPWRADFTFTDPRTGDKKKGWFRCPCHGSTYTDAGVRVFGPAPRSMDTMAVDIQEGGRIIVDTGAITKGSDSNPSRAVKV
jgi:cytochrome b6-f complex iron-sulfur subunit